MNRRQIGGIAYQKVVTVPTYLGNDARGGGISTSGAPGAEDFVGIELCNSTVANNAAICPIGGWTDDEPPLPWEATMLGGGLNTVDHTAKVHNTIFYFNESSRWDYGGDYEYDIGTEIGIEGNYADLVVSWSDVQDGDIAGTSCDMDSTGIEIDDPGTCVGTSIELNPLFDPLRPYHITNLSPCYNQGGTPCGDYDIDFEDRVMCGDPDMGADEVKDCA